MSILPVATRRQVDDKTARKEARMILSDEILRLRSARIPEDIEAAIPWYGDPEVLHYSEGPGTPAYDRDTVERMFRYLAEHGEFYIIEIFNDGSWLPIGDAALLPESVPIVIARAGWVGASCACLLPALSSSTGAC